MLTFGIQAEREKGICNLDQREALDQKERGYIIYMPVVSVNTIYLEIV